MPLRLSSANLCMSLVGILFSALASAQPNAGDSAAGRRVLNIAGWRVLVSEELWQKQKDETDHALEMLKSQLENIVRVVPPSAADFLRTVPLWVSPEYPGTNPRAEYHPDAGWLTEHHRNPAMAKGVEFTNVRIFERETKRMPVFILHELSHAYHDQVLGFDHKEVRAVYEKAKAAGMYEHVERWHGDGRPNTFERAYAMVNEKEYFAECSEAFFGRNDFFPFTRDELERHDPEMFRLLKKLWREE